VTPKLISDWLAREQHEFSERRPRSRALYAAGEQHYLYGAPLHWMRRWAGGFPLYAERASGTRVWCADDFEYVDLCLGDTGAMAGHAAPAVTAAVSAQLQRGATLMLPTEDAAWVGAELTRRFGLPYWGFTTSASDANRAAIRIARLITGRDRVLVFNGCYHGSVEEAHVGLSGGRMVMRSGVHPNAVDHERVSCVVEFNDLPALERALQGRDVALVLAEPCMTNYGMIEAQPGFLGALRELTRRSGTLLLYDETHTWSAGPGGYTGRDHLDPDMFSIGKAIGGGVPVALRGEEHDVEHRVVKREDQQQDVQHGQHEPPRVTALLRPVVPPGSYLRESSCAQVTGVAPEDQDGAIRVVHKVLANRAEQHLGEASVAAAADRQYVRVGRGGHQSLGRVTVEDAGAHLVPVVRLDFFVDDRVQPLPRFVRHDSLVSRFGRALAEAPDHAGRRRCVPDNDCFRRAAGERGLPDGPAEGRPRRGRAIDSHHDARSVTRAAS